MTACLHRVVAPVLFFAATVLQAADIPKGTKIRIQLESLNRGPVSIRIRFR
jgi:hypothetical protein